MKKILIIPIIILFISCNGYYKDSQVYRPIMSNESFYMVRVWERGTITNNGALIVYKLPMQGITDKKIDSINKVANDYIKNCELIDSKK